MVQDKRSVVIVGGGLSGLTAAALLAHHGIRPLVVERHKGTSIQYKFAGISPRSMEIFRGLGLEAEIRANRTGDQQGGGIARAGNLADPDIHWSGPAWPDANEISPTQPATCDQHVLEPLLRRHAERLGAETRFNTEVLDIEPDETGVVLLVRDRASGREERLAASYLIAADGANGTLREKLGIDRQGPGVLQHWMSLIFDTDLADTLEGRRFTSCFITDLNGTFTPRPNGRWLLALQYSPERGETPGQFDRARCRELVVKGAGRSDIRAELVDARPWHVAAYVADRFRAGRSFLIGDAAHLMPPTGGFGGNTGIHDAHNLAWKLAMVVKGEAGPMLLDSYDAERRPVANATLAQALARLQRWFKDEGKRLPPPVEIVEDYDVVFGQRYRSGAVIAEDGSEAGAFVRYRELSGTPGTRMPHVPIEQDGRPLSTHDFLGSRLLLFTADNSWAQAAKGLSLPCHRLGTGDAFGIGRKGAILVHPDGFVAWRSLTAREHPERVLVDALRRLHLIE